MIVSLSPFPVPLMHVRPSSFFPCLLPVLVVTAAILIYCTHLLSQDLAISKEVPALQSDRNPSQNRRAVFSFVSMQGFEGCWWANQYISSAAKLGVSLKRYSNTSDYDMVMMVTGWLSCAPHDWRLLLEKAGWKILFVDPIFFQPSRGEAYFSWIRGNRYEHTCQFTKLHLWNQVQYDVILYIDADALVVNTLNIERVFTHGMLSHQTLGMHACPLPRQDKACGADIMLLAPSIRQFNRLRMFMGRIHADRELQEQSYLVKYFGDRAYPLPLDLAGDVGDYNALSANVSIIHFIGNWKPWNPDFCKDFADACRLWVEAEWKG